MNRTEAAIHHAWTERLLFLGAATIVLLLAWQTLPHGDALRIVRQIEDSTLIWNPNHLIFDPLGYGAYHLAHRFSAAATPLGCFQLLSSVATLVTLWIFHAVLLRAGVGGLMMRLATLIGVFAAGTFLPLAGSQYFFMIQMPLLVGTIYLYVDFMIQLRGGHRANANLYWMGVLLALATGIMFNNLVLVGFLGVAIALESESWKRWEWRNTARMWAAAAAVGFPVFLAGHALSGTSDGLITWLLSYQGDSASKLNSLYGLKLTSQGIIQATLMVGFNFLVDNLVELAGLGVVLQALVNSQPLEFLPQWGKIALGCVAAPLALLFNLTVAYYLVTRMARQPVARFLFAWLAAYLLFNFLWNVGDEIFWMQIVPATWLAFLMSQGKTPLLSSEPLSEPRLAILRLPRRAAVLLGFSLLLLAVNGVNALMPLASPQYAENHRGHLELLRDGDLEIIPGWDRFKWMILDEDKPQVRRYVLMNMAITADDEDGPKALSRIIEEQLDKGGRVIVARVYDKDTDLMPWYAMATLGWSRGKILGALEPYCSSELARIDGVVFRELRRCDEAGSSAANSPSASSTR